MSETLGWLIDFVTWLFFTSIKATVVIAVIMIVQTAFRHRLSAKWLHALWFLLIVRLLIPVDVPVSFSLFNLTKSVEPILEPFASNESARTEIAKSTHSVGLVENSAFDYLTPIESEVRLIPPPTVSVTQIVGVVWLFVAVVLLGYTVTANSSLARRLDKGEVIHDRKILTILNRCTARLGIKRRITLLSVPGISSPFWSGFFKARIVLPQHVLSRLTDDQLEHIFMHELVHYKQKDVPLAMLATVLQILHWFNPFIWLAFFKMRADREAACDEIVLTNIGKDRNKQYGRTLISLIESASQRGLLPVAVGLADTKFNLKRRVTMISNFSPKSMWWTAVALLLISTIAVFALTGAQQTAMISGAVTFQGSEQPDSVYVGIYRLIPHDWPVIDYVGEPLQFAGLAKGAYRFNVTPGCYTVAAWAFGYERAFAEIIVPQEKSRIEINFDLPRASLPGPVTAAKVMGDFNDWKTETAPALQKSGSIWIVPQDVSLPDGSQYKFLVNGERKHHVQCAATYTDMRCYFPGSSHVKLITDYATFNNIYDGSPIVFNPAAYATSDGKAIITVRGFDLYKQFAALQDSLRLFEIYYHDVRHNSGETPDDDMRQKFSTLKARFERLEKSFDPFFAPIFHEYWLSNLLGFDASRVDLWELAQDGPPDSTALSDFLDNSTFVDYLKSIVERLEALAPDNVLIHGGLWEGLRFIYMYSPFMPDLKSRVGIAENYEYDYVVDFCKQSKNLAVKQELLYHIADTYVEVQPPDFDKAGFLINWLYRDIPDSWYITHASAENIRNSTRMREGQPAPMFAVTTLDGDEIYTSQLRGKFVFLEFWGSNCGPCRGESPHMNNLAQSISADSLVLIGLGHADDKKARAFVREQKLAYKNAVAPDHVLKKYGITYYPATYLIDPDGNIAARDLRGPELLRDVREKMRMYAKK